MKPVLRHILVAVIFLFGTATTSFAQFTCGDTLVDARDGKRYATVLIGSQCWMKQSLNYGAFTISVSTATTHTDMKNNLFTVGAEMESAGMFVYYPPLWAVPIIRDGLLF